MISKKKASIGVRLGCIAWLLPAVLFTWLFAGYFFLTEKPVSIVQRLINFLQPNDEAVIEHLHQWLWLLCFQIFMPLSSLYYLLRAAIHDYDQLRMNIYGFIHYILIYLTYGSHGAFMFGFVMLCISSIWLIGVAINEVRRLWWLPRQAVNS